MTSPDHPNTQPVDPARLLIAPRDPALPRLERLLLVVAIAIYIGVDAIFISFSVLGRA